MSESTLESPDNNATTGLENTDLRAEVDALRIFARRLQTSLIALVWMLSFFVFLQVWRAHKELVIFRQAAAQQQWALVLQAYENDKSVVQNFLTQLSFYGTTNKQFQPILQKYGIGLPPTTPAATTPAVISPKPPATPAASPPAAPKK